MVAYGLVRKTEQIDNSVTVKFCYIRWVGTNIPRMQRAKLPLHSGNANKTFHPYHVDIKCERLDEISDDLIVNEISKASGQKLNVLSNADAQTRTNTSYRTNAQAPPPTQHQQTQPTQNTQTQPTQNTQTQPTQNTQTRRTSVNRLSRTPSTSSEVPVNLKDEEAIRGNIQAVRRDDDPTDWCLVTYDAPKSNTLIPLAKGSNGLDEMLPHLKDDIVAYGLLRKSDQIDLSATVKFCFIDWRGSGINFMQRAKLGTHSGFVTELFRPYHVDIQTGDLSELSENSLMDKIRHAAGTKNYVKS
jgi:hypothetical protein